MPKLLRFFLCFALVSVAAWAADISGTWNFAVESDAGSGTPTFVFQQDGDKLTGTYSGAFGEAKVAGTVTGDKVVFSFEAEAGGDKVKVTYSGTVESASKMKGTVEFGGLGKGTWTGTKK